MTKTLRYLISSARGLFGGMAGFVVIVTVGCYLTGVPQGLNSIFLTYFSGAPMYAPLFLYLYAYSLATAYLNTALSMGGRRRDYFLALQSFFVICALVGWMLTVLVVCIPTLGHWTISHSLTVFSTLGDPVGFWCYPFVCLGLMVLGCLTGQVFFRSRLWGAVLLLVCMFGLMAGMMWLMIGSHAAVAEGAVGVNVVIAAISLVITGAGDFVLWKIMKNYSVR